MSDRQFLDRCCSLYISKPSCYVAVVLLFCSLFCFSSLNGISWSQAEPRDYAISTPLVSYSPDGKIATVTFDIVNEGGDAIEVTQITIADNNTGRIELDVDLPALAANQVYPFSEELPLSNFTEDDTFLKVEVGIDQYEVAGSPVARNNSQLFRINIAEARALANDQPGLAEIPDSTAQYDLLIPLLNIGISLRDDGLQINQTTYPVTQILIGIGTVVAGLVLLWFFFLILRLIFRRPPSFDPWNPPYAVSTFHDPNSAEGRRQNWQYYAQNSVISAACVPNQVAVIKRLVDAQGLVLGAWTVMAMRSEQYDAYGRLGHTAVMMPGKLLKQLNKLAARAHDLDNQQLSKTLQPIANRMSKAAIRAIEKQNRMLPIALELRFEGNRDDARVIFELYQCRSSAWQLLDQWEPEFGAIGSRIPEQFTYTLNGMLPGESFREFKTRLTSDIAQLLGGLLYHHQATEESETSPTSYDSPQDATAGDNPETSPDETTEANHI